MLEALRLRLRAGPASGLVAGRFSWSQGCGWRREPWADAVHRLWRWVPWAGCLGEDLEMDVVARARGCRLSFCWDWNSAGGFGSKLEEAERPVPVAVSYKFWMEADEVGWSCWMSGYRPGSYSNNGTC